MSKKLLTFLTLLTLFFGVGWAAEVTYSLGNGKPASWSPGGSTGANTCNTNDDFTIYFSSSNATNANYVGWNSGNTTMTVSHDSYIIESIVATCSNGTASNVSVSSGGGSISNTSTSFTWTKGNTGASSVSFKYSSGKQLRISQLKITYSSSGSQSNVGAPSISFSSFSAGNTTVTATINPGENATSTSYKIGVNGTYQTYNSPVEFDLTEVASPITVYAKCSDGTNESTESSATFTLPALGVSVSPSSYDGFEAQPVTITPTNYVGDVELSYKINDGTETTYSAPFTLSNPGTYSIVAYALDERAGGAVVTSSASSIIINETVTCPLPFTETFAEAAGTGPSGDSWSGNIASAGFKSDNEGWAYNNGYAGDQCARFGTGSVNGYATTPKISGFTSGTEYPMTFKAGAWNGDGTTLNLSASAGSFKDSQGNAITSVTMLNNAWTEYEVIFVPSSTSSTITFATNSKRFFLDEVNITQPLPEGDYYLVGDFNNWTQQDPNYKFTANADGNFILNGVTIADNSKFKIMKGSAWCGGGTSDSQYNVTSDWHTDMNITVGDAGKDYYMASGGTCYFTISDRFLLTVQKAPVAIRGDHNSWTETAMTATETGWTINNLDLVEGNEFQFIDGWGVYHGGDGAYILENYLGVALDMGTSGNYVVQVDGNYTITVNRWLNKMTADVARNTHDITCTVSPNSGNSSVSVTVDGSTVTSAKYLDEVTIVPGPDNGYTLSSVVVTGDNSGNTITVTSNKFKMPDEDVTIVATFTAGSYPITVESPHGTTTCPSSATVGQTVSFTVTPDANYTVTGVTASFQNNNGGTTAVSVSYNDTTGVYYFGMPPFPVTVTVTYTKQSSGGGTGEWQLVTDASQLIEGNEYIIVNQEASVAMSTTQNSNNRGETSITLNGGDDDYATATITEETQIFTLESTTATVYNESVAAWYFNTGSGYIYASSSGSNHLKTGAIEDNGVGDNAKATITFEGRDLHSVITFRGSNSRNLLRYNSNSKIFSCYGSGQNSVHLYTRSTATLKAPVISPEGGTFLNSQYPDGMTVTIAPVTDGSTVYYTTDGTEPSAANGTEITASTTITVTTTTTVQAIAILGDEASEVVSETYNLVDVILEDVQFSPIPGTYSGAQTLEMYTTTQNAKIYYEISDAGEVNDPTTSSTLYSNTDVINLEVGKTYHVKAIAYVGNNSSEIASGTYIINNASSTGLNSIAELNAASTGSTKKTMNNPIQVIYMNTWRHKNGTNNTSTIPEYAYIRDNTGYSMVYFGNGWYNTWDDAVDNPKICQMGDWIPGGVVKGAVQVWSDGFHNELGGKNNANTVTGWPTATDELTNTPIIPEEMTNTNINAGWSAPASFATTFNEAVAEYVANNNLSDNPDDWTSAQESAVHAYAAAAATNNEGYIKYVQDGNVWGHYVHLRKNTIRVTNGPNANDATDGELGESGTRKKYSGFITDQSGDELTYYDAFYNFSGFNGTPNYSNDFFQNIQNNGGTFDVYGIVGFYGPKAADAESNYTPFEVFPIDFLYIYKPIIHMGGNDYNDADPVTVHEQQTVTITCATEGATIYYKTSDMEDYAVYTPGTEIIVDATTTIETYSSIPTKYNDVMESVVNTLVINIGSIDAPVITEPSVVKTVGESVTTTITCVTDGATIYYTTDGSDPKTSGTRQVYSSALTFEETTTVRAIAYKEVEGTGYYSAEAEARTYTFVKSNGIIYDLVTDQTQLNESSVFIVVNKANHMAMGNTQDTNHRDAAGVKFVNDAKTHVYGNDDVAQFTLKKVGNKWYMQTLNGSITGYLYVGNGNTLLTGAATDAAEATINIDADAEHQAHISFVYNNETTRYLRYWNGGQAFSTYTSETSNLPVSLYYTVATPLANIEKEGVVGNQYTIADELIAVHYKDALNDAGEHYLWCKDQGNVSISKTEKTGDDQIDYLKDVTKVQNGDWDQSNWVVLKFTNPTNVETISGAVGKYINPASITGHYTDGVNFTITLPDGADLVGKVGDKADFTPNVYCPVNFLDKNLNIGGGQGPVGAETREHYFFMNPKIQEVATVTYAVWNGTCFVIPAKAGGNNQGDFDGAFSVAWTYNAYGDQKDNLQANTAYRFLAVLNTGDAKLNSYANTGAKAGENAAGTVIGKEVEPQAGKVVYALDLNGGTGSDNIITAIQDVADGTGKAVAGVKYYNLAGIESDRPFEGVNIVVTTYTDGSRSSSKVLK